MNTSPPTRRISYTVEEVVAMTGRSRWTIQRWLRRGVLQPIRIPGSKRMIQAASLDRLMSGEASRK